MGKQIISYENDVTTLTNAIVSGATAIIKKYNASAIAGMTGPLTAAQINSYATYLASTGSSASTEIGLKTQTGEKK